MDFYDKIGKVSLASRLRMLSERMMNDADKLYQSYGVDIKAKWFPVLYMLMEHEEMGINDMAKAVRQPQATVSKTANKLSAAGLITITQDTFNGERSLLTLTLKGKEKAGKLRKQLEDVESVVKSLLSQSNYNVWNALNELENSLDEESIYKRVLEQRKKRERPHIKIVDFQPGHRTAFKILNEAWISQYFELEKEDRKLLDDPQKNILDKNGHIFIALYKDKPVGTSALVPIDDPEYDYELGKMAVDPSAQGLGIGWLLGQAVVRKAKALGCKKIYLESNAKLKAALRLYEKMGFKHIRGHASPYARCDIQMEMDLIN